MKRPSGAACGQGCRDKEGKALHAAVLRRHVCRADSDHLRLERGHDFSTAYIQSCVFLIVTNWFDGIVVDRLWVGRGKLWVIKGMEGVPYVKTWKLVLTKRAIATVLYLIIALAAAGIVVLLGKL